MRRRCRARASCGGAGNLDTALTWDAIAWLRAVSSLPVVVKGILTAEDARLAVANGAAAIVVSNHGGRQLDGVPATLDILAEVVDACEVYVDGGIRRGTDVVKALALGARAALLGRSVLCISLPSSFASSHHA